MCSSLIRSSNLPSSFSCFQDPFGQQETVCTWKWWCGVIKLEFFHWLLLFFFYCVSMKASLFHYQVKIHYQRKYWPFMYQSWDNCYGLLDLKQSINQSNHLCRNNINAWSIRGMGQYFVLRKLFLTFSFSQILHFELNHSYWASSVFSSVGYLHNECFLFSGNP